MSKNNIFLKFTIAFIIVILIIVAIYFLYKFTNIDKFTNEKPQIVLITEYFVHKDKKRADEINECININNENTYLDKIVLLNENKDDIFIPNTDNNKIINVPLNKRSTFQDSFKQANKFPKGTIVIISNCDISFDDTLFALHDMNLDNTAICLGRRAIDNESNLEFFTNIGYSQDSWIFKTPVKIPLGSDFHFGTEACDGHIAYLLDKIGYNLINIPWIIKARHHHLSNVRKWISKPRRFYRKIKQVPVTKLQDIKELIKEKN